MTLASVSDLEAPDDAVDGDVVVEVDETTPYPLEYLPAQKVRSSIARA